MVLRMSRGMMKMMTMFVIIIIMSSSKGSRVEGGKKKLSSVWPTPNYSSYGKETIYLNPAQFRIHMIGNHSSPLLQRALARYQLLLFPLSPFLNFSSISNDDEDGGYDGGYEDGEGNGEEEGEISYLSSLAVSLSSSSSSLHFNVSEEYQLLILSSDDDLSTLPHPLPLSHSPLLYDYYHYYDNNNNDNNDNNNGNNDINDINNDNQKRSGEEKKMKKEYRGVIIAETSFGAIRGLETFYQLIQSKEKEGGGVEGGEGEGGKEYGYYIKGGPIIMQDSPRFPWRGVMVDTSRHFIPLPDLLLCIDAISYSKMNVLHWHISDSHSFPFQSHLYPNLPITSPWSKEQVYSREDIQYLVRYARDRGVRVIPEISLPSHCLSWLPPPLSILCDDVYEDVDVSHPDPRGGRKREMINPLDEEGRRRIDVIWKEISSLFTDEYIHMGMNDINPTCWLSDPSISHHLDSLSLSPSYLLHSFLSDLTSLSQSMGRSPIIWDEGLQYDPPSNQTIIQTYPSSPIDLFSTSIERGYRTLISRRWSVEWEEDWDYYYTAEDPNLLLASSSPSLALGGELLLWSSHIFHSSLLSWGWPNAVAVGGKLWSKEADPNLSAVAVELQEWRCKAARRGISSTPLMPDPCLSLSSPFSLPSIPPDDDGDDRHDDLLGDALPLLVNPYLDDPFLHDDNNHNDNDNDNKGEGRWKIGLEWMGVVGGGMLLGYFSPYLIRYSKSKSIFIFSLFFLSFLSSLYLLLTGYSNGDSL